MNILSNGGHLVKTSVFLFHFFHFCYLCIAGPPVNQARLQYQRERVFFENHAVAYKADSDQIKVQEQAGRDKAEDSLDRSVHSIS